MTPFRCGRALALTAAAVLLSGAGPAAAQSSYSLVGKLVSTRGVLVRIPLLGNTPNNCVGPSRGIRSGKLSPLLNGMTRTQTYTTLASMSPEPAGPWGCVSIAGTFTGPAGLNAAGATFSVPASAISKPLPGSTVAASVPNQPRVLQLATSFRIHGPPSDRPTTGDDAPGAMVTLMAPFLPTMVTLGPTMLMTSGGAPTNLAPLRKLQKNAYANQTGRAGVMFTWCYQYGACSNIATGDRMIAKVDNSGPNRFGGTMSYLVQAGPNPSTLAVGLPGTMTVNFQGLSGTGHQPTGRGYADLLTDRIMTGPGFLMHMEAVLTPPGFGGQMFTLITAVTSPTPLSMPGTATAATQKNYGFPWTTGTAIVMQTGSTLGNAMTATFTGRGGDTVSSGGARNLTLVAPQVARTNIGAFGTNTAGLGFLTLTVPEPGAATQLLAGALVLAALAAWRGRRIQGDPDPGLPPRGRKATTHSKK